MNFNYPEFLNNPAGDADSAHSSPQTAPNAAAHPDQPADLHLPTNSNFLDSNFNQIFNKLSSLERAQPAGPTSPLVNPFSPPMNPYPGLSLNPPHDAFNLPLELQGGIGTISSRRPSYAAESFTRSSLPTSYNYQYQAQPQASLHPKNLAHYAQVNNYNHHLFDSMNDSFQNFSLNANLNDFQSRRPSQIVEFSEPAPKPPALAPDIASQNNASNVKLENGLVLKDQYIMATPELKKLYEKTTKYFQDVALSNEILSNLHSLLKNPVVVKLITFIKNLNNLTFNHKILCLVVNKNGKFDLLSYPNSSNIFLQKNDLVIVDGDRGKDLVMILEPLVNLNFAILFNFLKKLEHLKSLTILDDSNANHEAHKKKVGGSHSTQLHASTITNNHSNEDNEFIITLPTKQVLRFATPKEIHKISGKFLEEKKAFITCHNKIRELNLQHSLKLINVEYQSDFKKLIFYYFANFKRIDFRNLIKELFKIYKTRIWLCAVLPHEYTDLNLLNLTSQASSVEPLVNSIPNEYNLTNEQIMNFSINEFESLFSPNYFHSKNLQNLIESLKTELNGFFYGFNDKFGTGARQNQGGLANNTGKLNPGLVNFNPLQ